MNTGLKTGLENVHTEEKDRRQLFRAALHVCRTIILAQLFI